MLFFGAMQHVLKTLTKWQHELFAPVAVNADNALPHSALSTLTSSFVCLSSYSQLWLTAPSFAHSYLFPFILRTSSTLPTQLCLLSVKKYFLWRSLNVKMVTGSKWTLYFGSSYEVKLVLKLPILLSQDFCHQDSRWVSYPEWVNNFN